MLLFKNTKQIDSSFLKSTSDDINIELKKYLGIEKENDIVEINKLLEFYEKLKKEYNIKNYDEIIFGLNITKNKSLENDISSFKFHWMRTKNLIIQNIKKDSSSLPNQEIVKYILENKSETIYELAQSLIMYNAENIIYETKQIIKRNIKFVKDKINKGFSEYELISFIILNLYWFGFFLKENHLQDAKEILENEIDFLKKNVLKVKHILFVMENQMDDLEFFNIKTNEVRVFLSKLLNEDLVIKEIILTDFDNSKVIFNADELYIKSYMFDSAKKMVEEWVKENEYVGYVYSFSSMDYCDLLFKKFISEVDKCHPNNNWFEVIKNTDSFIVNFEPEAGKVLELFITSFCQNDYSYEDIEENFKKEIREVYLNKNLKKQNKEQMNKRVKI